MKTIKVLIVDDDENLVKILRTVMELPPSNGKAAFIVESAHDNATALKCAQSFEPDVVLMDMSLPGPDGHVITKRLLKVHPNMKIIAYTGHSDRTAITRMIVAGAVGYLIKGSDPLQLPDQLRRVCENGEVPLDPHAIPEMFGALVDLAREEVQRRKEIQNLHHELEETYSETVLSLAEALRTRDEETQDHVDRVVQFSLMIGRELGLDKEMLKDIEYGALFHDIGKLGVPDRILHNTDSLTEEEWKVIRDHTIVGERILKPIHQMKNAALVVRSTHENFDGTGYPDQLSGEEIPLPARVIRVADSFDAMTSKRPYQIPMETDQAVEKVLSLSGKQFDPRCAKALCDALAKNL